jgi:hypothetical protein
MWNYICIDANPSFGLVIEAKKKKERQKELALHVKA